MHIFISYQSGDFHWLLFPLVEKRHLPPRHMRGMAHARLDTRAIATGLVRLKVGLVINSPLAVGGIVPVTLVDQIHIVGLAILKFLK